MSIQNKVVNRTQILDSIAEQWVNIVFTHLQYKKQKKITKKDKDNYGK